MASLSLEPVNKYIDDNIEEFKEGLKVAVAIKSVSSSRDHRDDVINMVKTVAKRMEEELSITVTLNELGPDPNYPDNDVPLPPVILASLGNDPQKKTLCIYGHLDVQPADISNRMFLAMSPCNIDSKIAILVHNASSQTDGWNTEPFVLTIDGDKMIGRGSSDDKGPVLGWLNTIEAFQKTSTDIPLNLKFIFEGMEESGSIGMDALVESEKDRFFKDVDYICISDNYWLGTEKPCLTYGLRGIVYFHTTVTCSDKDLHSGSHGGPVYEAMADLVAILSTLVDTKGNILIAGVNDSVLDVTEEEKALYDGLDFDKDEYQKEIGTFDLTTDNDMDTLMRRWRYPSLSIHGVEGAFYGPGDKTVIPMQVTGKFSIRLVPNQKPVVIAKRVLDHVKEVHKKRGSPNKLNIRYSEGAALPWVGSFDTKIYEAGKRATKTIYGVDPDYTREGGSIPIVLMLTNTTGKEALLLPMGRSDDGAHSQNEKLNISNFQNGMKLFAAYLKELAASSNSK